MNKELNISHTERVNRAPGFERVPKESAYEKAVKKIVKKDKTISKKKSLLDTITKPLKKKTSSKKK